MPAGTAYLSRLRTIVLVSVVIDTKAVTALLPALSRIFLGLVGADSIILFFDFIGLVIGVICGLPSVIGGNHRRVVSGNVAQCTRFSGAGFEREY